MSRADVAAALTMPRRDAHVLFYVYLFLPSPLFLLLAYPRVDVFVCLLSPRRPRGVWAVMMRRGSSSASSKRGRWRRDLETKVLSRPREVEGKRRDKETIYFSRNSFSFST